MQERKEKQTILQLTEAMRSNDKVKIAQLIQSIDLEQSPDVAVAALIAATIYGNMRLINFFLKKDVDVNVPGSNGYTALMCASLMGRANCVELLLGAGAKINMARSEDGVTALMLAAEHGHIQCAELLVKEGAEINAARSSDGMTALMLATVCKHQKIEQLLLDNGAEDALVDIPLDTGAEDALLDTPLDTGAEDALLDTPLDTGAEDALLDTPLDTGADQTTETHRISR